MVKFESFDGHHPKFENYPFKRRTQIVYDHAGHFGKHFPEVAKKDPARRIPATCSSCHNSREDKRVMAVAPFEQTCSACHLNQIIGKERASGPERHRLPDRAWPRPASAEEEERLDRRMAGRVRSRALTLHEGDDQPG